MTGPWPIVFQISGSRNFFSARFQQEKSTFRFFKLERYIFESGCHNKLGISIVFDKIHARPFECAVWFDVFCQQFRLATFHWKKASKKDICFFEFSIFSECVKSVFFFFLMAVLSALPIFVVKVVSDSLV